MELGSLMQSKIFCDVNCTSVAKLKLSRSASLVYLSCLESITLHLESVLKYYLNVSVIKTWR